MVASQNLGANATLKIDNTWPHSIYLVFAGTWNYSVILAVFPNNGSAPVVTTLARHSANNMPVSVSANGTRGISITNIASATHGVLVCEFHK